MHFDECTKARAVNIIDLLQINDNPCSAGCEEIVDHCPKPVALLSEHQPPFECQNVDSIHLTLRYFQWHRLPPLPQAPHSAMRRSGAPVSTSPISAFTRHFSKRIVGWANS